MTKLEKRELVRRLREQGKTYTEIARTLGCSRQNVKKFCVKLGLTYSEEEKERFIPCVDWSERIGADYTIVKTEQMKNGEKLFVLYCNKCEDVTTITSTTLRHRKEKYICMNCLNEMFKPFLKAKEVEKKLALLNEQTAKDKVRARKRIKEKQIGLRFCSCGALISSNRRVCDSCKHDTLKDVYRRAEVVRRAREKEIKRDKGITLKKLYDRDNGICYLCGKVCDWNDCKWENKVFIVGKNYPTVEHLVPIVRGGSDTWENIRLAHLSCNSKKGCREIASPPRGS